MPGLAQLLRRFRFTGVPGAPAVAGVPRDRAAALEEELAPVFAALEAAQRQADDIEAAAADEVGRRQAEAAAAAERAVAEAQAQVPAARAAATTASLSRSAEQRERLMSDAWVEVDRIARTASTRQPALVDRLADAVLGAEPEPP